MAADASFLQRFMLEYEWAGLRSVTLEASFILTKEQRAAAFDLLRQTRPSAFDRATSVWIMTIRTTHLAFQYRMVVRHFKSGAHFEVTLKTRVRRSPRINDLALLAT